MEETPNLNLPYIMAAQAQKHVTHNEAIRTLDAIVHLSVTSQTTVSAPSSPRDGERYIVPNGSVAEWADHQLEIAAYQDGAWIYLKPQTGWLCWVAEESALVVWQNEIWNAVSGSQQNNAPVERFGINTTADAINRLSVKSDAVRLSYDEGTNGSGNIRTYLNKALSNRTASMIFQSENIGRAEIGLLGSNLFSIKTSLDGASWVSSITVGADGAVQIGTWVANTVKVRGNSPTIKIEDRGGGLQGDCELRFNPDWGANEGIDWGGVGLVYQEVDETMNPIAPTGPRVGLGWNGRAAEVPYFVNKNGSRSDILTKDRPQLPSFLVSTLPTPSNSTAGSLCYVSNANGGATVAFSDQNSWRRVSDRAIIS